MDTSFCSSTDSFQSGSSVLSANYQHGVFWLPMSFGSTFYNNLRSYITDIITSIWSSSIVPNEWKKSCTALAHKKGDTMEPANFRPRTLESVPLKIFTSALRNSVFVFLPSNYFIEHEIQKGFIPKLSGTLECTSLMAYIINRARSRQRSLVITLFDLRNAFGEVHHNLIGQVLRYHHVPNHIKQLVSALNTDFRASMWF